MGLDISLYHSPDWEDTLRREDAYNEAVEALYAEIQANQDRDAEIEALMGVWKMAGGEAEERTAINEPSTLHPDHMFKIGYFRSSYNNGGFNRVVPDRLGSGSLYDIFEEADNADYYVKVDWQAALERARSVVKDLDTYVATNPDLSVTEVDLFLLTEPEVMSGKQALELAGKALSDYEEQVKAAKENTFGPFQAYSNRAGFFSPGESREVVAAIPGKSDGLGFPVVYLVTKGDDTLKWYQQAAEVIVETIEWVMDKPDPENYRLGWSG